MVEGRVVFAFLVVSVALTILCVIIGLRYLSGTLGGSDSGSSLLLTAIAVAVLVAMVFFARHESPTVTATS